MSYTKPPRRYVPCRECGKYHTNPASSSICATCGDNLEKAKLQAQEEEAAAKTAKTDTGSRTKYMVEIEADTTDLDLFHQVLQSAIIIGSGAINLEIIQMEKAQ